MVNEGVKVLCCELRNSTHKGYVRDVRLEGMLLWKTR